jgi:hypothetical protein
MTSQHFPAETLELAHEYSRSQDQESLPHQSSAIHEMDLRGIFLMGDVGLGSETALVLDYRVDSLNPKITQL